MARRKPNLRNVLSARRGRSEIRTKGKQGTCRKRVQTELAFQGRLTQSLVTVRKVTASKEGPQLTG